MSAVIDAKLITVVGALKQSIQQSTGPGSSVNSHPIPFFMNVTGELNLKHAAELIIQRVEEYEANLKIKVEASIKKAEEEAAALKAKIEAEEKAAESYIEGKLKL
jgi:predicted GTPase